MDSDVGKIVLTWVSSLSWQSVLIGLGAAALVTKLVRTQRAKRAYWARWSLIKCLIFSDVRITARRVQLAERRRRLEESLLIGGVLLTPER